MKGASLELLNREPYFVRPALPVILSVFFFLFFIIENVNGRFWLNDFRVIHTASGRLLSGGNVYLEAFGLASGNYKYSPMAAIFFAPFTILPFSVAKVAYFFTMAVFTICTLILSKNLAEQYFGLPARKNSYSDKTLLLAFVIVLTHIYRELHLGNVNLLLLTLALMSLKYLLEGRQILSGFLVGLCILFKPHFLVFVPLFVLRKQVKAATAILVSVVAGLVLPALFVGIRKDLLLHQQWIQSMIEHNAGIIAAHQTVYFLFNDYFLKFLTNSLSSLYPFLLLAAVAMLFLLYVLHHSSIERSPKGDEVLVHRNFIAEYFLLLALIPSVTLTDTEHFLLSLPLIVLLIALYFHDSIHPKWLLVAIAIGIIMYGGNVHDLVGDKISDWMVDGGILGIGNLILISAFAFLSFNGKRTIAVKLKEPTYA